MTTIEIVLESSKKTVYRAICGEQQAAGVTPGEALDLLEQKLGLQGHVENGNTLIILQRFRPDNFFTAEKQLRLRELMDRFHHANDVGNQLVISEKQELETLVDAEWNAAIERTEAMIKQTQTDNI